MSQTSLPWALLVIGDPSKSASGAHAQTRADPPLMVLGRALSLTSIAKTCCLIEPRLRPLWNGVTQQLWSSNVSSLLPDERVVEGVMARLEAIAAQEPDATVILIPFNHCAVEELTWLDSAKGALRLGSANRNTIYLLHDVAENDPRIAVKKPETCSSSVLVGSVHALHALCTGTHETVIVDLAVEKPETEQLAAFSDSNARQDAPLNLVHIRLAEEYARLQRADVWHRGTRQIDLHA